MTMCSDKQNSKSSRKVRFYRNDISGDPPHNRRVGRKRADSHSSAPAWDWFLADWMKTLSVNQTQLRDKAQWSKAAASEICSGKTGYSKRLVNEAAHALNIHPYELLMHPDDAMALRQMRREALRVVKTSRALGDADLAADEGELPERRKNSSEK